MVEKTKKTKKTKIIKNTKKTQKNTIPLRQRITKYILKRGDICCEEDFNRKKVINEIFKLYNNNLDDINNDIFQFIGYFIDLKKENDKTGMALWKEINSLMPYIKNKKQDKANIISLLKDMPLFYLLSFLGMAYYNKNNSQK